MPAAVTFFALTVVLLLIVSLGVAPFMVLGDAGGSDSPAENDTDGDADELTVDQEANETDALDNQGFGGDSFLGDSEGSAEENLSESEREENTHEMFQELLTNNGYEITNGSMEDGVISLEYRTYAEDREELFDEIFDVSAQYIAFEDILQNEMAEEYEGAFVEQTGGLHVTIIDYEGEEQGSYSIEGEWARDLYSGDMSNEEFQDRIEGTIEISDDFEEDDNGNDSSN